MVTGNVTEMTISILDTIYKSVSNDTQPVTVGRPNVNSHKSSQASLNHTQKRFAMNSNGTNTTIDILAKLAEITLEIPQYLETLKHGVEASVEALSVGADVAVQHVATSVFVIIKFAIRAWEMAKIADQAASEAVQGQIHFAKAATIAIPLCVCVILLQTIQFVVRKFRAMF